MPCLFGLAVSIHTPDGPLTEYATIKHNRARLVSSYVPVPEAKMLPGSCKPQQSTFAISITLLTPGTKVPYSAGKPTPDNPYPRPITVGGLPGVNSEQERDGPVIAPYIPCSKYPDETIAAYIYFDGREKEEAATLLKRGEETWVNSRWVGMRAEDGSDAALGYREFLFREVSLERKLNNLLKIVDNDAPTKAQQQGGELERKDQKNDGTDDDNMETDREGSVSNNSAPLSGDEDSLSSDANSKDKSRMRDTFGLIKIVLRRVYPIGDIKKGEYQAQHADDDDNDADNDTTVDHTTSLAKSRVLDKRDITTQPIEYIDKPSGPPYATFEFFYRSMKQLGALGVLPDQQSASTTAIAKKRGLDVDFSGLGTLTTTGTKNFATYRDTRAAKRRRARGDAMDVAYDDSDSDNNGDDYSSPGDNINVDLGARRNGALSAEDVSNQEKMSLGVRKMQLGTANPDSVCSGLPSTALSPRSEASTAATNAARHAKSPGLNGTPSSAASTPFNRTASATGSTPLLQPRSISNDASGQMDEDDEL